MHSLQNGVERWYLARFDSHRAVEPLHNIDAALEQLRIRRTMLATRERARRVHRPSVRSSERTVDLR